MSLTSVENFQRIEKLVLEKGYNYLPKDWVGNNDVPLQEALLEHMFAYILKLCLAKNLSKDVWCVEAKLAIDDHVFWYATDIFDDLSILCRYENLMEDVKIATYLEPKKLDKIYELYMEDMNYTPPFYIRIYEFVDECLQGDDSTWLVD
jgi:hypothetical protein